MKDGSKGASAASGAVPGARSLARNTLLNLGGLGAPLLAALIATPLLIRGLGTELFGALTMIWGVLGYFSVLDLGLGRALTQLVAERLGTEREAEVPVLVWTGLLLTLALGLLAAVAVSLSADRLVGSVLRFPPALQADAAASFLLLGLSLPLITSTAALRGVLEGTHSFGIVNALRLPMGLFTFFGPLLVLPFSTRLTPVVAVLVAGRVVACAGHLVACLHLLPVLRSEIGFSRRAVGPLLRFGGWMTVGNLASTLMVYLDRFLIGAVISLAAVAYYVTPYEVMWRLTILPGALLGVLFPAFAAGMSGEDGRSGRLFDWGARAIFLVMFPLTLVLTVIAHDALRLWLGVEFADQGAPVLQWMAVGIFLLSLGMVGATGLQGVGRPEVTGKLNLLELPFYLVALWWLVLEFGIVGAAVAWALRAGIDAVLLGVLAERASIASAAGLRRLAWLTVGVLPIFAAAAMLEATTAKAIFLAFAAVLFPIGAWHLLVAPDERSFLRARVTSRFGT